MNTEKAAGSAAKRVFGATSNFIKEQNRKSQERAEARRAYEAEQRRIYNLRLGKARESYDEVMPLVVKHNEEHGAYMPIRLASDPVPVKECTRNTSFWDCEDPNCWHHADEKSERGIGTPTRSFHPDFQPKAPEDLITSLFKQ